MPSPARKLTLDGRVVLLLEQAAERGGVSARTWSSWLSRRWPRGNPVPVPDDRINERTPVWYPATVDEWRKKRPSAVE